MTAATPFALHSVATADFPAVLLCRASFAEGVVSHVSGDTVVFETVRRSVQAGDAGEPASCPRIGVPSTLIREPGMSVEVHRIDQKRTLWTVVGGVVVILAIGAIGASQL